MEVSQLKRQNYQTLFVSELDKIRNRLGEEKMKEIYRELKREGQEAMSRELVIQLVFRYFSFFDRATFLARHLDLLIPSLFRIKNRKPWENEL